MCFSALVKVVIFLTFFPHRSAGTDSMQFFVTAVREVSFPEFTINGFLDEEQILYYDSIMRELIPKKEWMKKVDADAPGFWSTYTQTAQGIQADFKNRMGIIMQLANSTASNGVHTYQNIFSCELDDDGTTRGQYKYAYDGEDFISLDLKTVTFTATNPKAVGTKQDWESRGLASLFKSYLEKDCIKWLKNFVSYGRETLERKDPPEVSVFHEHLPSPEVVCHATGFFPSGLVMFWQKDGEELHEDVEIRETLPNQDGTFQKRAVLRVSPEELKEHEYTCVVQHSSLEKDLVLPVPDGGSLGAGAIVGIVLAVFAGVALVVAVGVLIWKKKKPTVRTRSSSFISTSTNSNTSEVSSSSE
ncbi:BOLA class I histocompatibility antigen, alpha chain BL3-7-like [Trichomycterus rosablanca]|uniref:BOLA class I histocompatibility antigen, alpha chain BL3-7-like n=1 Tax=Trichomycterus rosablanca TaxID=2290929 RepID=UPI002F354363